MGAMSGEKAPGPEGSEQEKESLDQPPSSEGEEGDPGEGFGVGGNIASIADELFEHRDDAGSEEPDPKDDPGEGFSTGGDVKAPKN